MADQVTFEAAGVVEVELFQALAGGEPGGADPALAAVGVAGGDLALKTGGEVFLVGPGFGAGAFGGVAQRRCFQRSGEVGDLTGGVALAGLNGALTRPRPHRRADCRTRAKLRCSTSLSVTGRSAPVPGAAGGPPRRGRGQ